MIVYFLILLSVLLFAIGNSITKGKYATIFCGIAVFILFFLMAFRDQSIGTDIEDYLSLFQKVDEVGINFLSSNDDNFIGYEKGYLALNYIISYVGGERLLLVVVSALYVLSVSHCVIQFSPYPLMSLALFVLGNFYFSGMNLLRQYIAIAILLFSIKYVVNRSFLKFLFILLIALSMHRTAIVFVFLYFVYPLKVSNKYILLCISCSILFYLFIGQYILSYILGIFELSKFEHYILVGADGGIIFYLFLLSFVLLGVTTPERIRNIPNVRVFFHMMILALLVQSFAVSIAELARLTQYFYIGFIVYLPCVLFHIKSPNSRLVLISVFMFLMLAYFIITAEGNTDSVIPYKFM